MSSSSASSSDFFSFPRRPLSRLPGLSPPRASTLAALLRSRLPAPAPASTLCTLPRASWVITTASSSTSTARRATTRVSLSVACATLCRSLLTPAFLLFVRFRGRARGTDGPAGCGWVLYEMDDCGADAYHVSRARPWRPAAVPCRASRSRAVLNLPFVSPLRTAASTSGTTCRTTRRSTRAS